MLDCSYRVKRLVTGKIVGLIFGIIAFWASGYYVPGYTDCFKWGLLLWYVLFGHIIANSINASEDMNETCKMHIHWIIPSFVMGGLLGLSLSLLPIDRLNKFMLAISDNKLSSSYWFVLYSIFVGVIIGFIVKAVENQRK